MPTITEILESVRTPGRYVVQLDDGERHTVSVELLERLALRVGRGLSDAELAALTEGARTLAVFDRALGLLAARGRSARELRRRLLQKGEEAAHVDAAIERLLALGLLDDREYALQASRSKLAAGISRRRVRDELARRGVDRELAAEAVEEVAREDEVDERDAAIAAARKRVSALHGLASITRRRRLYAYLARRGYAPDDIRAAMEAALGESEDEER